MTALALPHTGARHRWRLVAAGAQSPRTDDGPASVVRRVLARRGLEGAAAAEFLAGGSPGKDPFLLAGMHAAVERLQAAIRNGELVAVYGDFDVDGISATAVILETLWALGGRAKPYLPHRERDGYGVHAGALEYLAANGVGVVVTVDCGIRDGAALAAAASHGLDVIVTDHHALPDQLPDAAAVINPHRGDCAYGFTGLAGVGLAFKLAQALLASAGASPLARPGAEPALDLVALGTIADVVPLLDENRSLVRRGLEQVRTGSRIGLAALIAAAEVDPAQVTAETVAWTLAPRLNAAGRLDHALPALELLLTTDKSRARVLARDLTARNRQRQALTKTALEEAETALADKAIPSFVVHVSDTAPVGVLGLVAGRLCERLYRPVAALRVEGEFARASVRSIREIDVAAVLDEAADLLVRHGGHARAAGFTVRTADVPALEEALVDITTRMIGGRDLRSELEIDAEVTAAHLDWGLHAALEELAPFGEANPRPLLLVKGADVSGARVVGEGHLAFELAASGDPVRAIAFRQAAALEAAVAGPVDIVATLENAMWKGRAYLELKVRDLAPASTGVEHS